MFLKAPPHSIEAEQALLGGMLLDVSAWDDIATIVSESDFYNSDHQIIFRTVQTLITQNLPVDAITLSNYISASDNENRERITSYIAELAENSHLSPNLIAYAKIVRDKSILRNLINSSKKIMDLALGSKNNSAKEVLDFAEREIFSIAEHNQQKNNGPKIISEVMAESVTKVHSLFESQSHITGISTGFKDLDKMTAGLQPSDLIIVAGRPSMGKTTFAINIAENIAIYQNKTVLIFSLEMPAMSLGMRILSSVGGVNQQALRTGNLTAEDWRLITYTVGQVADKRLLIDDSNYLTPNDMRATARRVAKQYDNLGLIVVDYLQLMHASGSDNNSANRTNEISEISRALKSLARELNVPVIALSQLNRSLEQRNEKRPVMSDLRESGAIEQDADLIVFIYRDEVYNKESEHKGVAEIIIGKHRNGPTGTVYMTFQGHNSRFLDYAAEVVHA